MNSGLLKAGLKIVSRRLFSKPGSFPGNAAQICEQIVEKNWNGSYYQTGLGHFNYFWIRDFGIVTNSLIAIGNIDRVQKTVEWALSKYMKANKITLCINSEGEVFDAPKESIDALPWLIYSIAKSGYKLSNKQKKFLEDKITVFQNFLLDPKSGGILSKVSYSELRDAVNYKKSSYAVLMLYILSDNIRKLKLNCTLHEPVTYRKQLEGYWNGQYFDADTDGGSFSAECNLLPFTLGVIADKSKLDSILEYISDNKIDQPFPMKYTDTPEKFSYHWWGKLIMPNYAASTIWTWMGALYIQLLQKQSSEEFERQYAKFSSVITRYKNFPELLHPDGTWYETPLYRGDEGMVWSALYVETSKLKDLSYK